VNPGADDLVLKLILFKRGWAKASTWAEALARREKSRKPLTEVLVQQGLLPAEHRDALATPDKRQDYLKRMVEEEGHFWTKPPQKLGRYPVEGMAAQGGRAVVFRGVREHRPVAIKVLSHAYAFDLDEVERFRRQGDFGILLDHPNLVKVYDFGWDEATPYLVMQWVEGHPLSHSLEQGAGLPLEQIVEVIIQACRGMAHAHERGVLHKDLKPDNILVDRVGHAVISDFGVAQLMKDARADGDIVGTPAYMSPEQAAGKRLDPRADIFSLGATLYECLTRQQPFRGDNRREVAVAAAGGRFPHPRAVNPDIPIALEAIILKGMARQPEARHRSMTALGDALTRWIGGESMGGGKPKSPAERSWLGRILGRGRPDLLSGDS
jgi:serine/threonine protein kinase